MGILSKASLAAFTLVTSAPSQDIELTATEKVEAIFKYSGIGVGFQMNKNRNILNPSILEAVPIAVFQAKDGSELPMTCDLITSMTVQTLIDRTKPDQQDIKPYLEAQLDEYNKASHELHCPTI